MGGYRVYFAPQWHALSDSCVKEILDIMNANEKYIKHYWKYSFAPDELLIPTLVFNGTYRDNTLRSAFPDGTHYNEMPAIHHIDYEPVVRVFKEDDYEQLLSSDKLFARKFRSGISDKLIRKIDENRVS